MSNKKPVIKFALPVGSLNNPERGNTSQLLADAGFEVEGYEPKKEAMKPRFVNDPEIDAFADRPQNMPLALADGIYDAAILGGDWALEWQLAGLDVNTVEDLGYGGVRLVFAVKEISPIGSISQLVKSSAGSPVRIRTEYLFIANKAIEDTLESLNSNEDEGRRYAYGYSPRLVTRENLRMNCSRRNARIIIEESFGQTEICAINGSSIDCIVDSTQTGKSLREAGLREIGTVYASQAGLYVSASAWAQPKKKKKIEQIASLLGGVVRARSFEYVTFNVRKSNLQGIVNYLKKKGYAAKEPTVNVYAGNAVVSTLLPKNGYPSIVPELLRLGADDMVRLNTRQIVSRAGGERR